MKRDVSADSFEFSLILVRVKLKPPVSVDERRKWRERWLNFNCSLVFPVFVYLLLLLLLLLLMLMLLVILDFISHGPDDVALGVRLQESCHILAHHVRVDHVLVELVPVIVPVRRRLVQWAHHVLPSQALHAGREQARAVLWLDGVRRAAKVVVVVVVVATAAVERVLRERRRSIAVEQVQVCKVPVTGGTVAPGLRAAERDRRTRAQ